MGLTWPRGTEPSFYQPWFRHCDRVIKRFKIQMGHLRRSCCRKRGTAVAIPRASMGWDVPPTRTTDAVMLLGSIVRGIVVREIDKGVCEAFLEENDVTGKAKEMLETLADTAKRYIIMTTPPRHGLGRISSGGLCNVNSINN